MYQHNQPSDQGPITQGIYKCDGGLIRASISFDSNRNIIKQVWLTGDYFVNPRRVVNDLEATLKDIPVDQLESRINSFFENNPAEMMMLQTKDFVNAIEVALANINATEQA